MIHWCKNYTLIMWKSINCENANVYKNKPNNLLYPIHTDTCKNKFEKNQTLYKKTV
jgi:hypothetical protein